MSSVHSERPAVHRTPPKGRVYGVYALDWTQVYEVDGKVYAECTHDVRRNDSLKTCSEYPHFGQKFLVSLGHCVDDFGRRIDHRITYSIVACKRLIGNAIYAAATCMLPLRWSVSLHSADSW